MVYAKEEWVVSSAFRGCEQKSLLIGDNRTV